MPVTYLTPAGDQASESAYVRVRRLEGRLVDDDLLRQLPRVPRDHPHYWEQCVRGCSAKWLIRYLERVAKPCRLLDLGCGNGWLSNGLASIDGVHVTGLDNNVPELEQAARVFPGNPDLRFCHGDLFAEIFPSASFEIVLLAASIQYFDDLERLFATLFDLLVPDGEVHVIDSPFYTADQLEAARLRSRQYYARMGVPEMADRYFHHDWTSLSGLAVKTLYQPGALGARLQRRVLRRPLSPFPWIAITRPSPAPSTASSFSHG